jgi:hypothetical protein
MLKTIPDELSNTKPEERNYHHLQSFIKLGGNSRALLKITLHYNFIKYSG